MAKTKEEPKSSNNKNIIIAGVAMAIVFAFGATVIINGQEDSNNNDSSEQQNANTETLVEVASSNEDLSTLVASMQAADLVETLSGEGPFTVFAPANSAFEALPKATLDELLKPENKQQLADILTYHVVATKALSTDLSNGQELETVLGKKLTVSVADGEVRINGAKVITADVEASNGVAHVIDAVLIPSNTVVDIAINNDFTTLVAAVQAADLVETLSGEGPFTVFAPTDEAFAKLPAGTLESLLQPENKQQLADILTYHVVAGRVTASDIASLNGQNVTTVLGQQWHVLIEGDKVFIANPLTGEKLAKVIQTDVIGDNGIVHIIDSVLLPQ